MKAMDFTSYPSSHRFFFHNIHSLIVWFLHAITLDTTSLALLHYGCKHGSGYSRTKFSGASRSRLSSDLFWRINAVDDGLGFFRHTDSADRCYAILKVHKAFECELRMFISGE